MIPLAFLDQTFALNDLTIIALLVMLEGVLSIDNALVLGLLAKRLPKHLQKRALTYGLVGAFVFRLISIALAALLLKWWIVKLLGGGYLVYIAVKHLFFEKPSTDAHGVTVGHDGEMVIPNSAVAPADPKTPIPLDYAAVQSTHALQFWKAVIVIELTDIAFAIDSILAAIALVAGGKLPEHGFHPKLWVVVTGGILGVILMRFAAIIFIRLLEKFPRFETAAYLLVCLIGLKLLVDWYFNRPPQPTPAEWHPPVDFHSGPAFWTFWILMLACFAVGFIPGRKTPKAA